MAKPINYTKHIWEGWTVQDFINELEGGLKIVQSGQSWHPKITTREELKKYCREHQPYYKKYIPAVVEHFANLYQIKQIK